MKCASLQGADAESVAALDRTFRGSGIHALWKAFYRLNLERLRTRSLKQRVSPLSFAHQYAGAGEKEQALVWLRRAYRERCPHLPWIGEEEVFAEIRSDPRFQDILHGMKLPKLAQSD